MKLRIPPVIQIILFFLVPLIFLFAALGFRFDLIFILRRFRSSPPGYPSCWYACLKNPSFSMCQRYCWWESLSRCSSSH